MQTGRRRWEGGHAIAPSQQRIHASTHLKLGFGLLQLLLQLLPQCLLRRMQLGVLLSHRRSHRHLQRGHAGSRT